MADILTYRFNGNNGDPGSLQERIQQAVKHFYQEHQALPASIIVHPTNREKATEAAAALGLKVAVSVVGGCLGCEVWLRDV